MASTTSSYNTLEPSSRRKLFVQMSGAPGSGKSTMAELLRQPINAVVLDHDLIKSTLLVDDGISFDQAAQSAYRLDWVIAEAMMKQGWSIILDCTCNFQQILDEGRKLTETYGYEYWYIECRVDDISLLDKRLRQRAPLRSQRAGVDRPPLDAKGPHSEDSHALFTRWIENPCRPDKDGKVNIIAVDTTKNPEEHRDYILEQIFPPPK